MTATPLADRETAVYRLFNTSGSLLYVGITCNIASHFRGHARDKQWWPEVAHHVIEWHENRADAAQREGQLIADEAPMHNRALNPYRHPGGVGVPMRQPRTGRGSSLLTIPEVARIARVGLESVLGWIEKGELLVTHVPVRHSAAREMRISPKHFNRFITARTARYARSAQA